MKVGTDAMLLGAWTETSLNDRRILDVGCGSGIIALMLAQRSEALVDAIDVDKASVQEAAENFRRSPWTGRLTAIHGSLAQFAAMHPGQYDLVVSNPPFFQNSMPAADPRLTLAKHNVQLGLEDFVRFAALLLNPEGRLLVILPVNESRRMLPEAENHGLYIRSRLSIIPRAGKPANRMILEFLKSDPDEVVFDTIVLRDENGQFSPAYKMLTRAYHPPEYFRTAK